MGELHCCCRLHCCWESLLRDRVSGRGGMLLHDLNSSGRTASTLEVPPGGGGQAWSFLPCWRHTCRQ